MVGKPGAERRTASQVFRVSVGGLDVAADAIDRSEETRVSERYATIAELCAAQVAVFTSAIPEAEKNVRLEGKKAKPPTCNEVPAPATFTATKEFTSLHAVERFDGWARAQQLVVRTPSGFVLSPFAWKWDDPLDPGCPSIVRNETVEEARVENGHLIIRFGGTRMAMDPAWKSGSHDDGMRVGLVAGAMWCKDENRAMTCKDYSPAFNIPLGEKVQPNRDWAKRVPWSALPWKETVQFHIAPDGTLRKQG